MGIETAILAASTAAGVWGANEDRKSVKDANKTAERQRAESQKYIEKQVKQARGDLFRLAPLGQESRRLGAQAGLDLIGQTMPMQLGAFKGGNMAAQQMLASGFGQTKNALLGNPQDTNFQPVDVYAGEQFQVPQLPQGVDFNNLQFDKPLTEEQLAMQAQVQAQQAALEQARAEEVVSSGQLQPHKGHFHPAGSNEKVYQHQLGTWGQ